MSELTAAVPRNGKRGMKKELSVLMLLLAAETVADCCVPTEAALSTELIGSGSTVKLFNNKISSPSEPVFDASSSAGDSDSLSTPTPESEDTPRLSHTTALAHNAAIVAVVMGFLPWRKALHLRGVSRLWFEQSLSRAALLRMPATGLPAIFVPCTRDLDATEEANERLYACRLDGVTCQQCGFFNNERRVVCGNRGCRAAVNVPKSNCRIFLGQLRREGTVSLVRWLFEEVLDDPHGLVSVENHLHKITNRGKGCAWAYLRDESSCDRLLSFHRRAYYDVVSGVEGLWLVTPHNTEVLAEEAARRQSDRPRFMPRNPIVTELPAGRVFPDVPDTPPYSTTQQIIAPSTPAMDAPPSYFSVHQPQRQAWVYSMASDNTVLKRHHPYFAVTL